MREKVNIDKSFIYHHQQKFIYNFKTIKIKNGAVNRNNTLINISHQITTPPPSVHSKVKSLPKIQSNNKTIKYDDCRINSSSSSDGGGRMPTGRKLTHRAK